MFRKNILFAVILVFVNGIFSPVAFAEQGMSSSVPTGSVISLGTNIHKKALVLESFAHLGLALRLQRKCHILEANDAGALRYYIVQMRNYLNRTESLSSIVALNLRSRKDYTSRLKSSGGDLVTLCNKEAMTQIEETLTSAALINEMLGNLPFDAEADSHKTIMILLKQAARLRGAAKQCPERMQEPGFSGLVSQLSTNSVILRAMGTMRGIDGSAIAKLNTIEKQTASLPIWRAQCRVDIFQIQNAKMKKLISDLRQ